MRRAGRGRPPPGVRRRAASEAAPQNTKTHANAGAAEERLRSTSLQTYCEHIFWAAAGCIWPDRACQATTGRTGVTRSAPEEKGRRRRQEVSGAPRADEAGNGPAWGPLLGPANLVSLWCRCCPLRPLLDFWRSFGGKEGPGGCSNPTPSERPLVAVCAVYGPGLLGAERLPAGGAARRRRLSITGLPLAPPLAPCAPACDPSRTGDRSRPTASLHSLHMLVMNGLVDRKGPFGLAARVPTPRPGPQPASRVVAPQTRNPPRGRLSRTVRRRRRNLAESRNPPRTKPRPICSPPTHPGRASFLRAALLPYEPACVDKQPPSPAPHFSRGLACTLARPPAHTPARLARCKSKETHALLTMAERGCPRYFFLYASCRGVLLWTRGCYWISPIEHQSSLFRSACRCAAPMVLAHHRCNDSQLLRSVNHGWVSLSIY